MGGAQLTCGLYLSCTFTAWAFRLAHRYNLSCPGSYCLASALCTFQLRLLFEQPPLLPTVRTATAMTTPVLDGKAFHLLRSSLNATAAMREQSSALNADEQVAGLKKAVMRRNAQRESVTIIRAAREEAAAEQQPALKAGTSSHGEEVSSGSDPRACTPLEAPPPAVSMLASPF